jgi:hypothetical protein
MGTTLLFVLTCRNTTNKKLILGPECFFEFAGKSISELAKDGAHNETERDSSRPFTQKSDQLNINGN